MASVATRLREFTPKDLRPENPNEWRKLRAGLEERHETRREQLRFRRDPEKYLSALEKGLIQPTLPP